MEAYRHLGIRWAVMATCVQKEREEAAQKQQREGEVMKVEGGEITPVCFLRRGCKKRSGSY